jgi:cohesin loading factor subunit SCC2
MLYDATSFDFTYPTPETPSPQAVDGGMPFQQQKSPSQSKPRKAQKELMNRQAHDDNSTITVETPKKSAKHVSASTPQPSPLRSGSKLAVVIPAFRPDNQAKAKAPLQPSTPLQAQASAGPSVQISQPSFVKQQTPQSTPKVIAPGSNSRLAVIIPDLSSTFRPEDYEVVANSPDTPQHLSRKRKRSYADGSDGDLSLTYDQREKADVALKGFNDYIQDLFEADDQVQQGSAISDSFFITTTDGISLSTSAQSKVETHLQKLISVGRFSQVPLDDLLRLQKLCDNALKESENVDVRVDENMGDSEVETLVQQIAIAELGIKSARTALRLMAGGREEKQLYSEDVIQIAINSFKNVMETCIVPIVEMRSSGSSAALFKLLSTQKKTITNLLTLCRRLLSLLATLVTRIELSETVINTLEFMASRLIFVENAPAEKDSLLGVAKFDSLRVVAMDVLAQIFLSRPEQRRGIFDEILTSLEKLPVTKQSARQFRLAEGGSIQLVSALIMKLIQTSASMADETKENRSSRALQAINGEGDADYYQQSNSDSHNYTITSESRAEQQVVTAIQELKDVISPLLNTARNNASYVVSFIVSRAMNSTKTGDAPYRNLLDLFVEDFITCLNSTDWPAAELLLRLFLFKMVNLAEGDKTPAPAKNMALDLLGSMGAAISELSSHVRKTASTLENGDGELGRYLSRMADTSLENRVSLIDLVSWACGPFRVSLEFLDERCTADPQLSSAIGFFMAEWASRVCSSDDLANEDDNEQNQREYGRLAYRLRMMIVDKRWLSTEYSFDSVSPAHARLAYSLTLLNSQFCGSFSRVLGILLTSMASDQATVRSKSLKSVNQVLETDPTILDREPAVKLLLLKCANDSSVLVRDSALGLIGKCIHLRPALEKEMYPSILQRVNDSGVGVRKRAMKLSREIYLRNADGEIRSSIAEFLLQRVTDQDEGVQELARLTIEEVWMSPFYQEISSENTSTQFKLAMAELVALMVKTVQRGSNVIVVLDKVLQSMLSKDSKATLANFKVCKALVATMFENIIEDSANGNNSGPSGRDALHVLTIFAKSNPKLFTPEQVQLLQPYVGNIIKGDDLAVYRSVVIIFRHVLPHLSKVHNKFLISVRKELLLAISHRSKSILEDVIACLWIISVVLDDYHNIRTVVISSLTTIQRMKNTELKDPTAVKKVCKLLEIAGIFGKHCDLDPQFAHFQRAFPFMKDGISVSKLMTDSFAPFASPEQPLEVRKAAFEAIGMVCQAWPKNFSSANINTSFREVFSDGNSVLEAIIMKAFKEFLLLEEQRSELGSEVLPGTAADPTAKLGVMGGGQGDGIAIGIAQQFLPNFTSIALASLDDQALLATELIASITRQGLVHPKECGVTLIALETSPNAKVAELAFRGHRALHEKYETILERGYMDAVRLAYEYQRDVVQDIHGATLNPFAPKLLPMIEVLKISKVKNRKGFYQSLCKKIDFEPAKMGLEELPHHLEFSQFIIENMAFFEYGTIDELLVAILAMEKVVAGTGTGIAHAIETEIFHVGLDQPSQVDENGQSQPIVPETDSTRLLQLTASSMMLSCLWEARSFLRRQYGLTTSRREGKGKAANKDLNKAPMKVQGINGDKFWEEVSSTMAALESEETMLKQCRAFIEVLSIDQDFKIAAEGDEDENARLDTPSDEETGTPGPPGSGRDRKRKGSGTPGGRKKRARSSSVPRQRGRAKVSAKRASVELDDDEDGEWD